MSPYRLLFVCSGNTCRSPLAESLLRQYLVRVGRTDIEVSSAGISAIEGAPATAGAYLVGLEAGLDLGGHRARRLSPQLLRESNLVLTMTAEQARQIKQQAGEAPHVVRLGSIIGEPPHLSDVSDPFGGELDDYRETLKELEELVESVIRFGLPDPPE